MSSLIKDVFFHLVWPDNEEFKATGFRETPFALRSKEIKINPKVLNSRELRERQLQTTPLLSDLGIYVHLPTCLLIVNCKANGSFVVRKNEYEIQDLINRSDKCRESRVKLAAMKNAKTYERNAETSDVSLLRDEIVENIDVQGVLSELKFIEEDYNITIPEEVRFADWEVANPKHYYVDESNRVLNLMKPVPLLPVYFGFLDPVSKSIEAVNYTDENHELKMFQYKEKMVFYQQFYTSIEITKVVVQPMASESVAFPSLGKVIEEVINRVRYLDSRGRLAEIDGSVVSSIAAYYLTVFLPQIGLETNEIFKVPSSAESSEKSTEATPDVEQPDVNVLQSEIDHVSDSDDLAVVAEVSTPRKKTSASVNTAANGHKQQPMKTSELFYRSPPVIGPDDDKANASKVPAERETSKQATPVSDRPEKATNINEPTATGKQVSPVSDVRVPVPSHLAKLSLQHNIDQLPLSDDESDGDEEPDLIPESAPMVIPEDASESASSSTQRSPIAQEIPAVGNGAAGGDSSRRPNLNFILNAGDHEASRKQFGLANSALSTPSKVELSTPESPRIPNSVKGMRLVHNQAQEQESSSESEDEILDQFSTQGAPEKASDIVLDAPQPVSRAEFVQVEQSQPLSSQFLHSTSQTMEDVSLNDSHIVHEIIESTTSDPRKSLMADGDEDTRIEYVVYKSPYDAQSENQNVSTDAISTSDLQLTSSGRSTNAADIIMRQYLDDSMTRDKKAVSSSPGKGKKRRKPTAKVKETDKKRR